MPFTHTHTHAKAELAWPMVLRGFITCNLTDHLITTFTRDHTTSIHVHREHIRPKRVSRSQSDSQTIPAVKDQRWLLWLKGETSSVKCCRRCERTLQGPLDVDVTDWATVNFLEFSSQDIHLVRELKSSSTKIQHWLAGVYETQEQK